MIFSMFVPTKLLLIYSNHHQKGLTKHNDVTEEAVGDGAAGRVVLVALVVGLVKGRAFVVNRRTGQGRY